MGVHTWSTAVELDRTDPERPVAVTKDGRRPAGDVLIGADGIGSRTRDLMGLPNTLVLSGEMAYRALIPGEPVAADPGGA
ncbi:hypothetical protein [Streptomyces sp. NPDC006668]|uniref:hypothetical protein n=1 Tax=Streptomyces sp. NPDC006668 TaxID=3156903 RepID=UPI0033FE5BB0